MGLQKVNEDLFIEISLGIELCLDNFDCELAAPTSDQVDRRIYCFVNFRW